MPSTEIAPRPDLTRPDAGIVTLSTWDTGTPHRLRQAVDAVRAVWTPGDRPHPGPLSRTVYAGEDDRSLLHQARGPVRTPTRSSRARPATPAPPRSTRPSPASNGGSRAPWSRTAPGPRSTTPAPGCVVIVDMRFHGPDPARQRARSDAVFEAPAPTRSPRPAVSRRTSTSVRTGRGRSTTPSGGPRGPASTRSPRPAAESERRHRSGGGPRSTRGRQAATCAAAHRCSASDPRDSTGGRGRSRRTARPWPCTRHAVPSCRYDDGETEAGGNPARSRHCVRGPWGAS